jgi:hypothetical protein
MISGCTSNVSKEPLTVDRLERVTQELVLPPFLPAQQQIVTNPPKIIKVRMVVEEKEIQVSGDVTIQAMSFNGSVPGPIIVVHQEDYVELTFALQANKNVGEKVLLIHAQANRDSRPHLIERYGDLVWEGGSFSDAPVTNRETWFVPGGAVLQPYMNSNNLEPMFI